MLIAIHIWNLGWNVVSFFAQTDVFIAMELMGTCAEKLKKRIQGPIPEPILGKMTVAVSGDKSLSCLLK